MRDIDQNNGNDASLVSPSQYTFPVPAGLPAGKAILAWTWFNKIGNREMYMNCAPIILGGTNARRAESELESRNATQLVERDQSFYNALPDMFKANIGNCVTKEGVNIEFPNPGSSVEKNKDVRTFDAPPPSCVAAGSGNAPAGSAPAPVPMPTSAAGPAPTTTKAPVKTTLPGGVFIEKPTTTSKSVSTAPVVSQPAPSSSAPTKATTLIVVPTKATTTAKAPVATGGVSGAQSGPCSQEGRWNCIGGASFQQCASGSWSTPQSLAAGTTCTTGQSDVIDIKAIGARDPTPVNSPSQPASKPKSKKRVVRVNKKHLHRHLAGRS